MEQIMSQLLSEKRIEIEKLYQLLSEDQLQYIDEQIKKVKKKYLYKSHFHGLHHSEKVCLFVYLIGLSCDLDANDIELLIDAALYHDIGRQTDQEDTTHGLASANRICKVIDHIQYQDLHRFRLLQAIIDVHCLDDKYLDLIFENYDLDESMYQKYITLASSLKDADALDRARFGYYDGVSLKTNYLRIAHSKELVDLAYQINHMYVRLIGEHRYQIELDNIPDCGESITCLHAVGDDPLTLINVLDHGILSNLAAQQQGIIKPQNYVGNNGYDWVSVVPDEQRGTGYEKFINNHLALVVQVPVLKEGEENRPLAMATGLPANSNLYEDERFVLWGIDPKLIMLVLLPNDVYSRSVRDINFFMGAKTPQLIKAKIEYYKVLIQKFFDYYDEMCEHHLDEWFGYLQMYHLQKDMAQENEKVQLTYQIDTIIDVINSFIQSYMLFGYDSHGYGKEEITMFDMIVKLWDHRMVMHYMTHEEYEASKDPSYVKNLISTLY